MSPPSCRVPRATTVAQDPLAGASANRQIRWFLPGPAFGRRSNDVETPPADSRVWVLGLQGAVHHPKPDQPMRCRVESLRDDAYRVEPE